MEYEYSVTCTYDSQATPKWVGRFDNALEAVNSFNKFIDHGFANEYSTVNLSEPSGKMHTKVFYANGTVGGK
jgi:hypothetical protein